MQPDSVTTMPPEAFEAWYASGRLPATPDIPAEAIPGDGLPPWDTGQPQPAIVKLADAVLLAGRVLDVGCGTGDNALFLAERGFNVTGLDSAPTALNIARTKARARGAGVRFMLGDALQLAQLGEQFDTVIDSGLFHIFSDQDRGRLLAGLHAVLAPGGLYCLLCFSEDNTLPGPRRLTQAEIRAIFRSGWAVESIEHASFELRGNTAGEAWLARIRRT
jgi:SAM-dependent methyltransferase